MKGDILLQEECAIGPDDTLGDVYFKKIFPAGVASVERVCDLFRNGNPPRISQDESRATYESWCRRADVEIDWSRDAGDVYNLIRGSNPQPGAWTVCGGKTVQIYDSQRADGGGSPGHVIQVDERGVVIQAAGGRILAKRVRPQGGGKIPAGEWARDAGISPGTRLGTEK